MDWPALWLNSRCSGAGGAPHACHCVVCALTLRTRAGSLHPAVLKPRRKSTRKPWDDRFCSEWMPSTTVHDTATAQRCPWDSWISLLSLVALQFAVRSPRPCGARSVFCCRVLLQHSVAHQVGSTCFGMHLLAHAESFTTPPALQPSKDHCAWQRLQGWVPSTVCGVGRVAPS